jgi:hypothetical protein
MQVKNIECQIAQAQLGRYLAGEGMAGEAVRQLEIHLAKCVDCKRVLDEKRRALLATLEGASTNSHPAPVEPAVPSRSETNEEPPRTSASRLAQAILAKSAVAQAPSAPASVAPSAPKSWMASNWKTLALAGALAAVLIATSILSKGDILGPRASAALPDRPEAPAAKTIQQGQPAVVSQPSNPVSPTTSSPATGPSVSSSGTSKPGVHARRVGARDGATGGTRETPTHRAVHDTRGHESVAPRTHLKSNPVHKPARHKTVPKLRRTVKHLAKATPRPRHNGIRVYDSSGNPIVH